jgi:putative methyltransferase (TIGR04325 family)
MSVLRHLRPFIPPAFLPVLRRLRPPAVGFSGNYASWTAAAADASGYDSAAILERVVAATRQVAAGKAVFERDSVLFDRVEYSWPLLASLLQVANECGSLRVIDFGGSLGSTWRQNERYLRRLKVPVTWRVVEQEKFVDAGVAEFQSDVLRFHRSISDAAAAGVDVVLFCSSLCYVAEPEQFLRETLASGARFLIIDRLPLVAGTEDRIALQRVREPIYPASYPVRLFAEQRLRDSLLAQWRVVEQWDCELQPDSGSHSHGFFLERR